MAGPTRRVWDVVIAMAAAGLVGFAVWAVDLAWDVTTLRRDVEQRVGWLVEIHHVQGELAEGRSAPALPVEEMSRALRHDVAAQALIAELDAAGEARDDALRGLVPVIRGQTSQLSGALGARWAQLDALVGASLLLAAATLGLLVLARRHTQRLRRELDLRCDAEAARDLGERRMALLGVSLCVVDADQRLVHASRGVDALAHGWPSVQAWWEVLRASWDLPGTERCPQCGEPERHGTVAVRLVAPDSDRAQWFEFGFGGHGHDVGGEVVLAREVTAREELEGRMRVADRLATLGTLAAGVVHELNNPLTWVIANLSMLERHLQDPDATTCELIEDVTLGVDRVRGLAADLGTLSQMHRAPLELVDLNSVIGTACRMATPALRGRGHLVVNVGEVPLVLGLAPRLTQVLVNLILNAAQALPLGQNQVNVCAHASDGGVVLEVHDDGPGICAELLPRIFEPFVTTRDPGDATGLGLYVSERIVTGHGGRIEAQSAPGHTVMRVWLPAAPADVAIAGLGALRVRPGVGLG